MNETSAYPDIEIWYIPWFRNLPGMVAVQQNDP